MKHILPVLLVTAMVMSLTVGTAAPVQAAPTVTVYDQDESGWKAAVVNWETEDFDDATLNPGLSVTATWLNAGISNGEWHDRLVAAGEYDPYTGQWGPTTTTWTFTEPIYAFGGIWDPGVPGGPGTSIKVSIGGSWIFVGVIPGDYMNEFWGFVSDVPFTQVLLEPYSSLTGWCETYDLDNMVYSLAQGVKITLPSAGDTFWIEAEPEPIMPKIVARAELVGIAPTPPLTITEFVWNAKIKYTEHGRNDSQTLGPKSMLGETYTSWVPEYKNLILGGEMEIEVYVDIGGKRYQDKISVHIRGRNPSKETVKDTLGQLILQVICYKESYPKWHQFNGNDSGLPVFGPPSGFGLMQLDPPSSSVQIWNWLTNVKEGKSRWREKIAMSRAYVRQVKKANADQKVTNLSPEQEKRQAAYLYRGGCWVGGEFQYYYIWNRASKQWELNPNAEPTSVAYADDAMAIKEAVSSGNPPEGW